MRPAITAPVIIGVSLGVLGVANPRFWGGGHRGCRDVLDGSRNIIAFLAHKVFWKVVGLFQNVAVNGNFLEETKI